MKSFLHAACVSLMISQFSCGSWVQPKTSGIGVNPFPLESSPGSKERKPSFADVDEIVLRVSCLSCHAGQASPNLIGYSNVKAAVGAIQNAVFVKKTMPKNSTLTDSQMKLLQTWIQEGALESSSFQEAPTPIDHSSASGLSSNLSYSQINDKIIVRSCVTCHSPARPDGGGVAPDLSSYESLKANISAVEISVFQKKTMPKNGTLTETQQALLYYWIKSGAPELGGIPGDTQIPVDPTEPRPKKVTWESIRKEVIDVSCKSCHFKDNPNGLTDQTDLETFQATLGTAIYLMFLEKEAPMPPLPAQLGDEQKRLISEWLIGGQATELLDETAGPHI